MRIAPSGRITDGGTAVKRAPRRRHVLHPREDRTILGGMKTTLAKGDVELYRQRGFLWIQDMLDAGELEAWRADVDAAVAARDAAGPAPHPGAVGAFMRRVNLWCDT